MCVESYKYVFKCCANQGYKRFDFQIPDSTPQLHMCIPRSNCVVRSKPNYCLDELQLGCRAISMQMAQVEAT
jgi:hypothetical protein